jgi:hypothetical protein
MDSFVIAVLVGGVSVILVFVLLLVLDRGKPSTPAGTSPAKVAGRR